MVGRTGAQVLINIRWRKPSNGIARDIYCPREHSCQLGGNGGFAHSARTIDDYDVCQLQLPYICVAHGIMQRETRVQQANNADQQLDRLV